MANERLYQFPSKASPVPADIIYAGDSANGWNEVQVTIAQLIGTYPNLLNIGNLTLGANTFPYVNNSSVFTAATITSFGVSLVAISGVNNGVLVTNGSSVPSMSSSLPTSVQGNITTLGTQASALNMNSHQINNVSDPTSLQDVATKNYVDSVATGGGATAYAATTANLNATQAGAGVGATLTNAGAQTAFTLDGTTPAVNSRILVKNQSTNTQNGVYILTNAGSISTNWVLTRAADYDTPADINDTGVIPVANGTANAGTGWINTTTMVTVDTTAVTFIQFTYNTSTFLQVANNLSDVANTTTALSNLGGQQNTNIIIEGNFDTNPWQRGTSFSSVSGGTYTADRFAWLQSGAAVVNVSKAADAPTLLQAGVFSSNCLQVTVATGTGTVNAGDYYEWQYTVEGYDFNQIAQRPFTFSFWVKSNLTGTFCVAFNNGGTDRSYVAPYTINAANTWQKIVINVPASPAAGTWYYDNRAGLYIYFSAAMGSTRQTGSPNTWVTGNYLSTSGQVNLMASSSNYLNIALIKLEAGSLATPYFVSSEAEVLAKCQRYFEKTEQVSSDGYTSGGINISGRGYYKATKRTTPTISNLTTTSSNNMSGSPATFNIDTNSVTIFQGSNAAGACFAYWTFDVNAEF